MRSALERWAAENQDALDAARDRHAAEDREFKEQQQASIEADPTLAEQPALRIIHMGSDLPEIPADVKRVAELQKQQAEIRNAILEDFEDLDSIETILALRDAMSAALAPQQEELQRLHQKIAADAEEATIQKVHEKSATPR